MGLKIFQDKHILLGVSGSIACYKSVELASKLTQAGALVDVVLTESALKFITPLSFSSVTGRKAHHDMWDPDDHIQHVFLGESADLVLVAPSTAQTLAKLAHGLADNLLTVSILAARCPLIVAPAMDAGMYDHAATRANIELLKQRGVLFAGPVEGRMASGLVGLGRFIEPKDLFAHIRYFLSRSGPLRGRKFVVTAGPTIEAIDPVRMLTNRSSGRQGIALAQAALDAGADVTLISGPTAELIPHGVQYIGVDTALQMRQAVLDSVMDSDVLIMAAAVSDFRPRSPSTEKIKKKKVSGDGFALDLERNPDILTDIQALRQRSGKEPRRPLIIMGFAAETSDVMSHGQKKMVQKGLDLIAINDVSAVNGGFSVGTNKVVIVNKNGQITDLPLQSKFQVGEAIINMLKDELDIKGQPPEPSS